MSSKLYLQRRRLTGEWPPSLSKDPKVDRLSARCPNSSVVSQTRVFIERWGCLPSNDSSPTGITLETVERATVEVLCLFPGLKDIQEDIKSLVHKAVFSPHEIDAMYTITRIPKKSGGVRVIEAPSDLLKKVQRVILERLLYAWFTPGAGAYGFIKKKGILNNAQAHHDDCEENINRWLWKADLQDFFPSISGDAVLESLCSRYRCKPNSQSYGLNDIPQLLRSIQSGHSANRFGNMFPLMMGIMYLCTYQDRLPQGAPTSPALSNIVYSKFDRRATGVVNTVKGVVYSRYADDICISANTRKMAMSVGYVLTGILENYMGAVINPKKVAICCHGRPMRVTGININHGTTISRYKRDTLRGWLHSVVKRGWVGAQEKIRLIGYQTFYKSIHEPGWTSRCGDDYAEMLSLPIRNEKGGSNANIRSGSAPQAANLEQVPVDSLRSHDGLDGLSEKSPFNAGGDPATGG